jgi:phosphoglycerate kinase
MQQLSSRWTVAIRWISDKDLDVRGKRVLVRVDFNVPLETVNGKQVVTDDERVRAALPTIKHLVAGGAKVLLASHLGRPKGVDAKLSLLPVAGVLQKHLGSDVIFADDCVGDNVKKLSHDMRPGQVVLLENLRFHSGEEKNDDGFAQQLAALCDVYVNDAFGAAHRAHASTAGVVPHVAAGMGGLLLQRETEVLYGMMQAPKAPFVAILGGAKVSDKIMVLQKLMQKTNVVIIGGAMAFTFLKAKGENIGKSRFEEDKINVATTVLEHAARTHVQILLPVDHVATTAFDEKAQSRVVLANGFDDNEMGLDIGPQTRTLFGNAVAKAGTVFWNGPMGVFEWDSFAAGTMHMAQAVAANTGTTVVGGGDSVAALNQSGFASKVTHVSTGGGASLELLEGQKLPGLVALGYPY